MIVNKDLLLSSINIFKNFNILVIGDIILDRYVWGKVTRISPEAPVPVVNVLTESIKLGGAGNVANNVNSLGSRVCLVGIIGKDNYGSQVASLIEGWNGYPSSFLLTSDFRPTTSKTRVIAHSQQVVRIDREVSQSIEAEEAERVVSFIEEHYNSYNAIIISDYDKGFLTPYLMERLRYSFFFRENKLVISIDPKIKDLKNYTHCKIITPNIQEAYALSRESTIERAGKFLLKKLRCEIVVITQGKMGMTVFSHTGETFSIPTVAKQVFDVSGAGDTVIAVFTLAILSGLSIEESAHLANLAAGIVVGEVGTVAVTKEQLKEIVSFQM